MKRNILQVPIKLELRKKAEMRAEEMGFSSLQELVRVVLTQLTKGKGEEKFGIDDLCEKYGVKYLGLFGSVARGEEKEGSDMDLLVKFDGKKKIGLFELAEVEEKLGRKLGRKVDLVTKLNKYIEPFAKRDLRTIYEKK